MTKTKLLRVLKSNELLKPIVGAIRWDAWHGDSGEPGKAVQKALGPKQWHHRLPFFARVISDTEVKIDGYSQEIIDQEIEYAQKAALDYWAFVTYEPDSSMTMALNYYLSSSHRQKINFCLILEAGRFGAKQSNKEKIDRIIHLMAEPMYQKVLDNRPLFYVGFIKDEWIEAWGGPSGSRKIFDEFRSSVQIAGLKNPYIVIMDFNPEHGSKLAKILGADAISSYATSAGGKGASYRELSEHARIFWDKCKTASSNVVPIVMSGWDRRPRVENPVPWETYQKPGVGIDMYYESPTPEELASHLKDALNWVKVNNDVCPSRAIIIYAWNENDEGGWLVPTLSEGTARINAISKILKGN
jgi:hypothetical protein